MTSTAIRAGAWLRVTGQILLYLYTCLPRLVKHIQVVGGRAQEYLALLKLLLKYTV